MVAAAAVDDSVRGHERLRRDLTSSPIVNAPSNPYSGSNVDPNLVNAWGIAFNPQGFVWVANNGTSTSTLYDGNGVPQSLVVAIPAGSAGQRQSRPASSSTARRASR